MRILITFLFLFTLLFTVNGQVTTSFRGTINIYQSSGTAPNYEIRGIFNDTGGQYTSDSVEVGDKIFILEADNCVELEVISVISTTGGIIRANVRDIDTVLVNQPLANGAILEVTPNSSFPTFVDGISNDLLSCIQTYFAHLVDAAITNSGDGDGIYGRNDTIPSGRITYADNFQIVDTELSNSRYYFNFNPENFSVGIRADSVALQLSDSGGFFTDYNVSKEGLKYAASGYVTQPQSLADKEYVDNAVASLGSGDALLKDTVYQAAHGFSLPTYGFVPVYNNGGTWTLAQADDTSTLHMAYVVAIPHADTIVLQELGRLDVPSHGLTVGAYYFLDDDGDISTTGGYHNDYVVDVWDDHTLMLKSQRAIYAIEPDTIGYLRDTTEFDGDIAGPYNNLQIKTGAVTSNEIQNGTITTSDLAFTPVTGSGATDYITYWNGTSTIVGDSRYRVNHGYPALEIYGSYNSNQTMLRLSAGGSNPIIETNTNNNGLILKTGGNGSYTFQNTSGTTRFEIVGNSSRAYFNVNLGVGLTTTPSARLHVRGIGTTSTTYPLFVDNSVGTGLFGVNDGGGVYVYNRAGTATALAGFDSNAKFADVTKGNDLTLISGTLNVNRDTFPTFATLPPSTNIGNSNLSLTSNRTLTTDGYSLNIFKEDNDYDAYGLYSNFYERIGEDTFNFANINTDYPIVGKSFSLNYSGNKAKLGFGIDPDWAFGSAFTGTFRRDSTEFDPGLATSFIYNSYGYNLRMADPHNVDDNIIFNFDRTSGLTINREDGGTQFMNLESDGISGIVNISTNGVKYDGSVTGQTVIGNYIETVPYATNFPTALAGWSTAPLSGSKYISNIDLGNLQFSNDTLNAFIDFDVVGTTAPIEINTTVGTTSPFYLAAGSGMSITAVPATNTITLTPQQSLSNSSNATSHTVSLSNSISTFQLVEGSGVTLTTTGDATNGVVTIAASGATGESNTASNLGAGAGVYEQKVSLDLQFNSLKSESASQLTVAEDDANNTIDFTINTGAVANAAATLTTGDQVYDFVTGQGYLTAEVDGSTTNEAWTIDGDDADTEVISNQTVKFEGAGITATDYNTSTNVLTITSTESDGNISNEGSLTVGAGTGTTSIINSNTSGSTGITLEASTGLGISESGSTITLTNTGDTNASDDITGTIAATQIAYGTGANTVAGESGFLWDATNNRLGIGLTPLYPIHVEGALTNPYVISIRNTSASSGNVYSGIVMENDVSGRNGSIFKTNTGYTTYKTIAANDMGIYNGNVAGHMTFLNDYASGEIKFAAGGASTAQVTIQADGDVGFGTTSPTQQVHILKNQNAGTALRIENTTVGTFAESAIALAIDGGKYAAFELFSGSYTTAGLQNTAVFTSSSGVTGGLKFATLGAANPIRFHTNSDGATNERMVIEGDGDVGIGVAAPQEELHLVRDANSVTAFKIENNSTGNAAQAALVVENSVTGDQGSIAKIGTGLTTYKTITARDFSIYNATTAGDIVILNDFPTGEIQFGAGGTSTNQMVIQADGDVGIGNTAPGAKLEVTGAFRLSSRTGTADRVAGWVNSTGQSTDLTLASGLSISGGALTPADASPTNELQTIANTSDATSHTVTLSNSGGSIQLVEGSNITLTTTGTSGAGIVTIAATGGSTQNLSYDAANREVDISGGGTSATLPLAVDDGATEGLASFTAADFNVTSGNVAIDYINGQAASSSNKGFLTSADWTTFNNKLSAETDGSSSNEGSLTVGAGGGNSSTIVSNTSGSTAVTIEGGTNVTVTESGSTITIAASGGATDLTFTGSSSPYTLNSSTGADVTFRAGEGIGLSRSSNELTITAPVMTAATGGGNGAVGIVPQPNSGENVEFLRGDATWAAVEYTKNATIENPGSSENVTLFYTRKAITIREVADVVRGTSPSVTWQIKYATTRDSGSPTDLFSASRTTTSTSGATTTTFNDATIGAGNWIWLVSSATSGTNDELSVTLTYTID